MLHNQLSGIVVDVAMQIHKRWGPGLLESAYLAVLAYELRRRGLDVVAEVTVPVVGDDVRLDAGFRADLIVENMIIIELKSVEKIAPVHKKQLLTYLRPTDMQLGLLINFGEQYLKDGIPGVVNGLKE